MLTRVHLLALPESSASVLYGLYDVLRSTEPASAPSDEQPARNGLQVRVVAPSTAPFACDGGVPVAPHCGLEGATDADVVIVPDLALRLDEDPRTRWRDCVSWLREQHARGAILCSVCTGSLLLANTGLLNGREATTHWAAATLFRTYFPEVRLQQERLMIAANPEQSIVTAGGGAAWEELALYLVRRYCGAAAAIKTTKLFVLGDRSAGQLPYASTVMPRQHADSVVASCQRWIAEHYSINNPVTHMVQISRLPERTFKRRFRRATGYTPVAYVQSLRIELAKARLETTTAPFDAIAVGVGYEDSATFRRLFKRYVGLSPLQYRRRFQALGALDGGRISVAAAQQRFELRE